VTLSCSAAATRPADVVAVGVPVFSGDGGPTRADGTGLDAAHCKRRGFTGKVGQTLALDGAAGALEVLVGLGERTGLGRDGLRRAGAALVRAASECASASFDLDGAVPAGLDLATAARSVVEGAALAAHRYVRYKSHDDPPALGRLVVVAGDAAAAGRGVERGTVVAEAVILARDLVNTPAADLTPVGLADAAGEVARREGLSIEVLGEEEITAERLGGLLGVARGSAEPPRLVRLTYEPPPADDGASAPTVALVGKGITFDSGGLSLKPAGSMTTMKTDMSGAAAVLATLGACRRLGVGVRVIGLLPATENMPGGRATKPGDVLTARNGKTIEVLNTDAEGRLVLADALSLAAEERPDAIVDLATLTGACVVALGRSIAGVMGNDDRLVTALREAGARAGEPSWHLPLPSAYRKLIDSEVADMNNQGTPGQAGALTAGLLLKEFVGDVPWAHLDIAGPARSEEDSGYVHKGATGFGVRSLLELLEQYEALGGAAAPGPTGELELP